jgi:RecA-family ATPase
VQQFVKLLARIAIVTGGSVLLITHPSVTGIGSSAASHAGLAGSTQWHNAIRARAVLQSVKSETGEPSAGIRSIAFHKNQYGAISATCFVRWQAGLYMPVEGMSADAAERAAKAEQVFVALLRRFTAQHQSVNHRPGPTYAPTRFAEHQEAQGITKKEFAQAMQRLLDNKVIEARTWGRPSRASYYLAIVGES